MSALALTFKLFRGDQLLREETLRQGVIKIGKVASAHLRVDDDSVSRMHAILEVGSDGSVQVIDLGSTRGTFINGHKVNKAKLESGDAIQVGDIRIEVAFVRTDAVTEAPVFVTPIAPTPKAPPKAPPPHKALFGASLDDDPGAAKAIEVAAMLGDSIVGVKHCIDPKSGKVSAKTYGMFAAGAACLLASAISFGASVNTAAKNKGGLEYTTRVLHHPAYSFRPEQLNPAFDWIAFGGLALGASAMIAGLARARGERRTPFYRIGTAPGVELALESAPSASFPLVAPSANGDDFVFNYTAGIEGDLTLDGKTSTLAELAAAGSARPSMSTAGALELPIPARARIRARSGQTTFAISAVPQPRQQPVSLLGALESRTAKYFAGSLVVHICLLGLLNQLQADDGSANVEFDDKTDITASIKGVTAEDPAPDKPDPTDGETGNNSDASKTSMKAPDADGTAGRPDTQAVNKRMAVKDNHTDPAIAREHAVEEARISGILGSMSAANNFTNVTGAADVSSGFDDVNAYGNIYGAEVGDANGTWGMSRSGFERGGGCSQPPCGLLGVGTKFNTISTGTHVDGGNRWSETGPGMRRHQPSGPILKVGTPTGEGDIDAATIRRYINRNLEKIRFCYEHELVARPTIEGGILVKFFISPTGAVTASSGSGFDTTISTCVAEVVSHIEFPRPHGGVQVNYPFTFRAPQ
jgi:FHA domain